MLPAEKIGRVIVDGIANSDEFVVHSMSLLLAFVNSFVFCFVSSHHEAGRTSLPTLGGLSSRVEGRQ